MPPTVHILVSCRNPELWRASTLVFDTLRVGFPTAPVVVHGNALSEDQRWEMAGLCEIRGVTFKEMGPVVHHEWIDHLVKTRDQPFYICDTDVIFWESSESWNFSGFALAGRRIPRFYDEVTACITYERLHTALLYIDPARVKRKARQALDKLCTQSPFHVEPNLVYPVTHYQHGQSYFHDTTSQLYHAIGGKAFTPAQLNCFDHLNCGTYIDLVEGRFTVARNLRTSHQNIFKNPKLARGIWRRQDEYYEQFNA